MNNMRMNQKLLGDPCIPFESRFCPFCQSINWCAGRNPYGVGCHDLEPEAMRCWHCDSMFWVNDDTLDEPHKFKDVLVADGVPDPVVPREILETLADAATEQIEDLRMALRKDCDHEIQDMIDELAACIAFVRKLTQGGPLADLPIDH